MAKLPTLQLDYIPSVAWYGRRHVQRRIAATAMLIAVIVAGMRWGPLVWRHVELYRVQRQCMAFVEPPNQLMFVSDPSADPFARRTQRMPIPKCWVALEASFSAGLVIDIEGSHLSPLAPLVFLHRRCVLGGAERLVVVQFGAQGISVLGDRVLRSRVIDPATSFHAPAVVWEGEATVADAFDWTVPVRVFAGRADDLDPSHFTIDVEVDENPKVFDGWLQVDDTVKMQVRDRPTSKP